MPMPHRPMSYRPAVRRVMRWAAALVVALVATVVVPASAASASPWEGTRVEWGPCSNVWTYSQYGGHGRIGMHYRHNTTATKSTFEFTHITLDTYLCSGSEPRASAARLDLSESLTLQGTQMTCSWSISLPPGVSYSCTSSPTQTTINFATTCSNASHCEIASGPITIYAPPGTRFRSGWALMQGFAHLVRSDGALYPFGTKAF